MKITAETLQAITVFSGLELDERQKIAKAMHIQQFSAKQILISQYDESTDVFFVVSGTVRAAVSSASGKEVSFQDLGAGEMFGELAAIDGESRSTTVVTLSDAVIASMHRDTFWNTLLSYPEVAAITLKRLSRLIRLHTERIFEFSTLDVRNRIHAELLRLARKASQANGRVVIQDPPTHAEIASRVKTHREAVTKELKHMESLGLVEWHRGQHVINDVEVLEKMVKDVRGH